MAMVKITNGINTFNVTEGAFGGIFSHQGYTKVTEDVNGKQGDVEQENVLAKKSEEEEFLEELVEKPLSQWNKDEVKKFASLKEIDISKTKNANEAKSIIKDFLKM